MSLDLYWYIGDERDMYILVCILFIRLESFLCKLFIGNSIRDMYIYIYCIYMNCTNWFLLKVLIVLMFWIVFYMNCFFFFNIIFIFIEWMRIIIFIL